ncbi:hypothetical protein A2335_01645 [Candidatus Peregrinibacteria bacterium RIFOXYB2_FULL_32_7]|nr:MAG: hypothetical protein A2335_01645 [Candidatus Peregrinibacteria bacterium RIFOXYB2_FULL_32_7]
MEDQTKQLEKNDQRTKISEAIIQHAKDLLIAAQIREIHIEDLRELAEAYKNNNWVEGTVIFVLTLSLQKI